MVARQALITCLSTLIAGYLHFLNRINVKAKHKFCIESFYNENIYNFYRRLVDWLIGLIKCIVFFPCAELFVCWTFIHIMVTITVKQTLQSRLHFFTLWETCFTVLPYLSVQFSLKSMWVHPKLVIHNSVVHGCYCPCDMAVRMRKVLPGHSAELEQSW